MNRTKRLALDAAYEHMSRGSTVTRLELGSLLMATQFIRRERGPTLPPAIADGNQRPRSVARYGVVVKEVRGADRPTFQATAYVVDRSGARATVVNEGGRPLVAVGVTPLKATSYLLAALRRRTS